MADTRSLALRDAAWTALRDGLTLVAQESIYCGRYRAVPADRLPAVVLRLSSEAPDVDGLQIIQHGVPFEVAILSNAWDDLDAETEPIRAEIHALLMADPTLGGACAGLRYVGTEREPDDRDEYLVVTLRYAAVVVTQIDDLTAA